MACQPSRRLIGWLVGAAMEDGKGEERAMPKENTAAGRVAMPSGSFGGGIGDRARIRRQGMSVTELYLRRKRFLEESGIVLETDGKPLEKGRQGPVRRRRA